MSGLSPARRLRSKTSDLGDFFRGGGHVTNNSRQTDVQSPSTSADALQVPESSISYARKRVSRIPFLGRSRKKSTHEPNEPRDSELDERPLDKSQPMSDDQSSIILISPPEVSHPPSTPSDSPTPTHHSFGSKLAAHFTPSKHQKLKLQHIPPRKSTTPPAPSSPSGTLHPPDIPRASSFDSLASAGSRSTTPRPSQPTITVSPSPDGDYDDLFTQPRPRRKSALRMPIGAQHPSGVQSEPETDGRAYVSGNSQVAFPRTTRDTWSAGYPSDAESLLSNRASDSISLRRKQSDTVTRHLETPPWTDLESAVESDSPLHTRPSAERRKTLGALPSKTPSKRRSSATSSRPLDNPHKPPDLPLPATPSSTPPASPIPAAPSSFKKLPVSSQMYQRSRATTLTSISSAHILPDSPSTPQAKERSEKVDFNIETASAEQLRYALRARIQEFDDRLTKILAAHAAEKAALEQRISDMEDEAARREKEIKGLTWLVKNRSASPSSASGSLSDSASKSMSSLSAATHDDAPPTRTPTPSSIRLPQYRRLNADDSGAESYSQTSGAESTGDMPSSFRGKKVRRHKVAPPSGLKHFTGSGMDSPVPEMPGLVKSSKSKRSSVSSMASSASTVSSTLPPTPTPTSLSAIPETPPLPPLKSIRDPAIAAAILAVGKLREKEKEERRVAASGRPSNRHSAPSPVSPAPTPAAAYAANLRKGRPPSIAQVLNEDAT